VATQEGRIGQGEGPRLPLEEVSTFFQDVSIFSKRGGRKFPRGVSFWVGCV
jgi:hypothetical protein